MSQSYTTSFTVQRPARQVFDTIVDVRSWWTGDIAGDYVGDSLRNAIPVRLMVKCVIRFRPNGASRGAKTALRFASRASTCRRTG